MEMLPTIHTHISGTSHPVIIVPGQFFDAVLGDDLDEHALEVNGHPSLQLVGAESQDLESPFQVHVGLVMLVEDGQTVVLCVAMRSVGNRCQRGQIIEPVERRLVRDGIDSSEQQIDIVRFARAKGRGELTTHKTGDGGRGQINMIAHRVELDIGLDILGKLNYLNGQF